MGCPACYYTGYRNRMPINEVLIVDDSIQDQLVRQDSLESIKASAIAQGKWLPNSQQLVNLLDSGLIDTKQFLRYIE